jgi:radical SAM protein with 4Fe4S-binding SPASM domain
MAGPAETIPIIDAATLDVPGAAVNANPLPRRSKAVRAMHRASRLARKTGFFLRLTRFKPAIRKAPPRHLEIEITTRCNATCGTCTRGMLPRDQMKTDLSVADITRILDLCPSVRSVRLLGLGEPFLHPEVEAVFQLLKRRGIRIWTISNGSYFLEQNIRRLALDHLADIAVSIDSADPQQFAALRPMGAIGLPEVNEGLSRLVAERDESHPGMLIGISHTISHENLNGLPAIVDMARVLRVDYLALVGVENWLVADQPGFKEAERFGEQMMQQAAEMERMVRTARKRLALSGILTGFHSPKQRIGGCYWPYNSTHICANGSVTPCCIRTMPDSHEVGNIADLTDFDTLWNGDAYQSLRQAHMDKDTKNRMCGSCPR